MNYESILICKKSQKKALKVYIEKEKQHKGKINAIQLELKKKKELIHVYSKKDLVSYKKIYIWHNMSTNWK